MQTVRSTIAPRRRWRGLTVMLFWAVLAFALGGCASDRPPDNSNSPKTVSDFVGKPRPNF